MFPMTRRLQSLSSGIKKKRVPLLLLPNTRLLGNPLKIIKTFFRMILNARTQFYASCSINQHFLIMTDPSLLNYAQL